MARRIDVTLEGLHHLLHRIERKDLVDGDWAICGALVVQLITQMQGKQERMAAKLAASAARAGSVINGQLAGTATGASPALGPGEHVDSPTSDGTSTDEEKKVKGHGRKGASAFVNAKHVVHALAAGLVGALCTACGLGRLTRYREKVVIRVVGQPLFATELHHLEQARCRLCGRVVRADAAAAIACSLALYGLRKLTAVAVRELVSPWRVLGDSSLSRWRTLERWCTAMSWKRHSPP